MSKLGILSSVLITAGCSAASPIESDMASWEYRRADAHIQAIEEFARLKQACMGYGGIVVLHRHLSGRMPPTTDELRLATCSGHLHAGR